MDTLELIEKVKTGNDDLAYQQLLKNYNDMIYYIINAYELKCGDYVISKDDLYQEASLALYHACKEYRADRNTKFSTFAFLVIKRKCDRYYRVCRNRYSKEGKSIDNYLVTDHHTDLVCTSVSENPIAYHYRQDLKERLYKITNKLTDLDRDILLLRIENYSYKEIAEKLSIKQKKVDNRLTRLRRRYFNNDKK